MDMGMNRSIATFWKNGTTPKMDTLSKIADYFEVPVGFLVDGNDTEKKAPTLEGGHKIDNPDIRMIARAGRKMTPEQAENLRKYAQFMYPEAFDDNE